MITRVLMVCMGNICRSPTAEGVFRDYVRRHAPDLDIEVDSAGTHDYHVGEPPDPRSVKAAASRGIDLSSLRARQVERADFDRFDLLLAMDEANLDLLRSLAPPDRRDRARLFLGFADDAGVSEVPDPYYGGSLGFENVLDLVEAASAGLVRHLRERRGAP